MQQILSFGSPSLPPLKESKLSPPTTPVRKPLHLSSPIKTSLKCMKCHQPLEGNHICSSLNSFHVAASFPPMSPKTQLTPLRKRSFNQWTEENNSYPSSPSTCRSFNDDEMSSSLFGDENEIITLPSSLRSPNKAQSMMDKKKSRKIKPKDHPQWSSFSFSESFLLSNKPKGHLMEVVPETKKRSNSLTLPSNGFTFVTSANENMQGINEVKASDSSTTSDINGKVDLSLFSLNRSCSVISEQSECSSTTAECLLDDDSVKSPSAESSSKVEGIGLSTGLEEDLDLSMILLECDDNHCEWQKLMNFPSNDRENEMMTKPMQVKETVFDEKEFSSDLSHPNNTNEVNHQEIFVSLHQMEEEEEELFRYLNDYHPLEKHINF